ncbi:hypothetical protein COCCU_03850 [Corynebacterium occultum]|uniref:Uncharacterized protein n=1 Tax=Corynebacterium occultum TaxID=2675219 RepID=A0A6B8WJU8_9CORY|nr:hypothetical protein [Corynebacterium occultum]QGU06718.1 hypothetical protein COCCU_03850 [Corynebacterium occultum]
MDYHKPTFLDIQRREIVARIVEKDEIPALSIDQIQEDGSLKRLLLLNSVDAQQLTSVCEIYLKQVYSSELSGKHVGLSPKEMLALFSETD